MNVTRKISFALFLIILGLGITSTDAYEPKPILPIPDNQFVDIEPIVTPFPSKEPIHATSRNVPYVKPEISIPPSVAISVPIRPKPKPAPTNVTSSNKGFRFDPNVSWYGPGFYGRRTACGLAYTKTILGVAHKSLPCGTLVTFRNPKNGRTATVPVIDRGPYVAGRQWDLSGGLCVALDHCYTGSIYWHLGR